MHDYKSAKHYKNEREALEDAARATASTGLWWAYDKKDREGRSASFIAHCQKLKNDGTAREEANIRFARLYENVEINSLTCSDFAESAVRQALLGSGLMTFNVVASAIDTLNAKISKNKPRPMFLTSGGTWKQQRKSRKLNKFMQGVFYETQVYEKGKLTALDAEVFGTGLHYWYKNDDGRLEVEKVSPSEMFVDDADGLHGSPRQMVRRKLVQKEVLAAMFPEKAEEIMAGPEPVEGQTGKNQNESALVEVWEGWHLPSSAKSADGWHVIAMNNCELHSEVWKLNRFPFVVLRGKPRVVGFWGKGSAETLLGIQLELNRLIRSISEQLRRKGRNQVFLQMGSKVNPKQLTNAIGDIVMYSGQPPIFNNQNAVSQEDYMQVDRLYQRAFQEVGVSELSAAAKKPAGLDAGVALREYQDIESERFALKHQAWDRFFMESAEVVIGLITTQYPSLQRGYKVKLAGRRRAVEIDWADVDLDADSYVMQIFPTSSLPQTPAARKQFVKELQADGMIDQTVAKRLLEFPDVETEMDLGNAALDDVDATISAILDEEKPAFNPPEPYQNLELLMSRAQANYLFARHFEDIEPERLEMLRQLIDAAANMLAEMMAPPPAPAMPGAAPGVPVAPPMPMNISNTMNAAPPAAPVAPPIVAA